MWSLDFFARSLLFDHELYSLHFRGHSKPSLPPPPYLGSGMLAWSTPSMQAMICACACVALCVGVCVRVSMHPYISVRYHYYTYLTGPDAGQGLLDQPRQTRDGLSTLISSGEEGPLVYSRSSQSLQCAAHTHPGFCQLVSSCSRYHNGNNHSSTSTPPGNTDARSQRSSTQHQLAADAASGSHRKRWVYR